MTGLRRAAIACSLGWAVAYLLFLALQRPVAESQDYLAVQTWWGSAIEAALVLAVGAVVAVQARRQRSLRPAGVLAAVMLALRLSFRRAIPDFGDHPLPILLLEALNGLALALLVVAVPLLLATGPSERRQRSPPI